jgi:hypothetical protein
MNCEALHKAVHLNYIYIKELSVLWTLNSSNVFFFFAIKMKELLHRVKKELDILHTIKRMKANCILHFLSRNCLLKHVIEGKIEG